MILLSQDIICKLFELIADQTCSRIIVYQKRFVLFIYLLNSLNSLQVIIIIYSISISIIFIARIMVSWCQSVLWDMNAFVNIRTSVNIVKVRGFIVYIKWKVGWNQQLFWNILLVNPTSTGLFWEWEDWGGSLWPPSLISKIHKLLTWKLDQR